MDQEDKVLLREIKDTVTENNKLLKTLVFQGKLNIWIRITYWALLILITVGAFAIVKPIMKSFASIYTPGGAGETIKILSTPSAFEELKAQLVE